MFVPMICQPTSEDMKLYIISWVAFGCEPLGGLSWRSAGVTDPKGLEPRPVCPVSMCRAHAYHGLGKLFHSPSHGCSAPVIGVQCGDAMWNMWCKAVWCGLIRDGVTRNVVDGRTMVAWCGMLYSVTCGGVMCNGMKSDVQCGMLCNVVGQCGMLPCCDVWPECRVPKCGMYHVVVLKNLIWWCNVRCGARCGTLLQCSKFAFKAQSTNAVISGRDSNAVVWNVKVSCGMLRDELCWCRIVVCCGMWCVIMQYGKSCGFVMWNVLCCGIAYSVSTCGCEVKWCTMCNDMWFK